MKKVIFALIALLALSAAPSFALEADYIPMSVVFAPITTNAGTGAIAPLAFVAPENITVKAIYVTETNGVVASSTDYATFSIKDDGTAIQAYSTTTALTAMTPKAFTIVTAGRVNKIAKGSVVTMAETKVGAGVAIVTPTVQLIYTIGW